MVTSEKKILITGFEPFDHATKNISAEWVKRQQSKTFSDRLVAGAILPVVFHKCFLAFREHFEQVDPDIIILTGLAQNRQKLSVERIGINWMDARIPDNDGQKPVASKILADGPDGLFTTLDLKRLQKLCPDLVVSTSAGEYVCNDLLYEVLNFVSTKKHRAEVTFFHLPGQMDEEIVFNQLDHILENY